MPGKSRIYFIILAALLYVGETRAAPPLTVVQDTLYKADGTRFDGIAQVEWPGFRAVDGSEIPQHSSSVRIANGTLRVALVPTTNALKTAYYTVRYNSNGRVQFVEYWSVPPSSVPLKLQDVRSPAPLVSPIVAPITAVGISEVLGLRGELDSRISKGAGYLANRIPRVNASGALEAVTGGSGDCIRVDGTSGPCGSGGILYVDSETPSGLIDGANRTFTLSASPLPATSLSLFRNGTLLKLGTDFTVAGSVLTMANGSAPSAGDRLLASYRVTTGTTNVNFVDGETPTGALDGINLTFTLLRNPVPASSLQVYRNGVLQKAGVDYDVSVNVITFRYESGPQPNDILQAFYRL